MTDGPVDWTALAEHHKRALHQTPIQCAVARYLPAPQAAAVLGASAPTARFQRAWNAHLAPVPAFATDRSPSGARLLLSDDYLERRHMHMRAYDARRHRISTPVRIIPLWESDECVTYTVDDEHLACLFRDDEGSGGDRRLCVGFCRAPDPSLFRYPDDAPTAHADEAVAPVHDLREHVTQLLRIDMPAEWRAAHDDVDMSILDACLLSGDGVDLKFCIDCHVDGEMRTFWAHCVPTQLGTQGTWTVRATYTLPHLDQGDPCAAVSLSGTLAYFVMPASCGTDVCFDASVHVLDGLEERPLAADLRLADLAWAPDGRHLAVACRHVPGRSRGGELRIYDTHARRLCATLTLGTSVFSSPGSYIRWSPGACIILVDTPSTLATTCNHRVALVAFARDAATGCADYRRPLRPMAFPDVPWLHADDGSESAHSIHVDVEWLRPGRLIMTRADSTTRTCQTTILKVDAIDAWIS